MKYRNRKTNEIVDVVSYSGCSYAKIDQDYVCFYDSEGNKVIGKGLSLIWDFEPINEESANNFDWQSFRAEAAKDILCALLNRESTMSMNGKIVTDHKDFIEIAIIDADLLIAKLKEKEEKDE